MVREGFVSAYLGAPLVTSHGESFEGSTAYPFYPGREIFSPLFLGRANGYELYVARTTGTIRNAVVLPGFADNYFHFLFDTIGALALIEPGLLDGRDFVLFSHGLKSFHRDVFELLGIAKERLRTQTPGRYAVAAENVVVVDYPTPLTVVHPRTVPFLRDALLGARKNQHPGNASTSSGQARAGSRGEVGRNSTSSSRGTGSSSSSPRSSRCVGKSSSSATRRPSP